MRKQVIKSYSFISVIIGLILCYIESYPKDNKIDSKVSIYSQEELNNYLKLIELDKTTRATNEITEIILTTQAKRTKKILVNR